ncbi:uncharacterized protein LOC131145910 [Malania oleifera]|uniref:uncharacterized protein LOC131145910 n=1 Tax=Malania oleifera TaxID=397392 RepID=UPI0025ADEDCB|nr:uncharacterized protein LOC131145910 [Malania oleifera]
MKKYLSKAQEYAKAFVHFDIGHLPRAENKKADALAKLASATSSEWKDAIYLERIRKPSYEEDNINSLESEISKEDWRVPLFLYLWDGSLPEDNKESQKIRRNAAIYTLIGRELYRRSLTLPYLRCLSNEEGKYVLREIHEGVCGNHLANRALAHKAMQQGFYWPTMKKDALKLIKRCDRGRTPSHHNRAKHYALRVDISVAHPLSNGQVENMNRTILHGLRTRLESMQGRWTEELSSIIWAYHTTKKVAIGETPFMLIFGAEAVIPAEVGIPSWRRQYFNEQTNNEKLRSEIDLLEERQDQASLKVAAYQQRVAKYYNNHVRVRNFQLGDLVIRKK